MGTGTGTDFGNKEVNSAGRCAPPYLCTVFTRCVYLFMCAVLPGTGGFVLFLKDSQSF